MIALLIAPFYLLLVGYVLLRMLRWMSACNKFFSNKIYRSIHIAVFGVLAFSPLIAFLIRRPVAIQRFFKVLSNYWFGVLLYTILVIIIFDIIRLVIQLLHLMDKDILLTRTKHRIYGAVASVLIICITVYGFIHVRRIYTTDYQVTVEKSAGNIDDLKIVLVADLHLGYSIGAWQMQQMVDKINAEDADLVVIAGDIFDNEYAAIKDPEHIIEILKGIQSNYGVYACWGNHDVSEAILAGFTFKAKNPEAENALFESFLEAANIQILADESVLIDDSFYVVGRMDYSKARKEEKVRMTPAELTADLDQTKPIIVIDHQPRELQELADAGVDLDLCGHTHDGQLFPGTLTINLLWENACGYLKKDEMHNIVTSGIGIWGPNMRINSNSEICAIQVDFQ